MGAGEIKYEAIGFVLNIHRIDEDLHEKLFVRIRYIDQLARDMIERRTKDPEKLKRGRRGIR